MLDQFVVTSSKSEVKRRESPSLVNVMTGKLLILSRRVFTLPTVSIFNLE